MSYRTQANALKHLSTLHFPTFIKTKSKLGINQRKSLIPIRIRLLIISFCAQVGAEMEPELICK